MSNNITIPATGTGTATPVVETIDTGSAQRQVVTIGDRGGGSVDAIGSLTESAPASDTASSGLNGRLQRVAQRLTSLIALLPSALTPAGGLKIGRTVANPTSTLTRPSNTTAYAVGQLIASSVTAGSVTVPSFTASASNGTGSLRAVRLSTNKTSGMGGVAVQISFWSSAPTFTNGDGAAYAVATGAANFLGSANLTLTQAGDGAFGKGAPNVGASIDFALSGTAIYWSMQVLNEEAFTPASGQTFTLAAEIQQD